MVKLPQIDNAPLDGAIDLEGQVFPGHHLVVLHAERLNFQRDPHCHFLAQNRVQQPDAAAILKRIIDKADCLVFQKQHALRGVPGDQLGEAEQEVILLPIIQDVPFGDDNLNSRPGQWQCDSQEEQPA